MRFARDFGTVRELFPDGIDSLWDLPWKLAEAIFRALIILSWDNLPKDERPPENIWGDDRAIKEWFDAVEANRKTDADPDRQIEDPVDNAAAKGLIVG